MRYIAIAALLFLLCNLIKEVRLAIVCVILGVVFFVIGVVTSSNNQINTKEFPKPTTIKYSACNFDLKLKVTEYDGKRDTIYVFTYVEGPRTFIEEHPASKYELKLRITEFEGQRDTTYVLTKKINEFELAK